MAAEGGAIITFIFNGEGRRDIPRDVTHLIIHESITVIPARLFWAHPNLVEVYCHAGVTKIKQKAFSGCPCLRRVIIPGVIFVEACAFDGCINLIFVECNKLETIGSYAFDGCESLGSINLPSTKIVGVCALSRCPAMTAAIFGKGLESFQWGAFHSSSSLERITIPLKNSLLVENNILQGCVNLVRVDLVEDEALGDFSDAFLLEDWRNDINKVLASINEVLPDTAAGDGYDDDDDDQQGEKVIAIREWIESVLRKVTHYKAVHRELLDEASIVLQMYLPNDTVMNNVLPFVELPALTLFGGEDEAE